MYATLIKPLADFLIAFIAFVLLLPIFVVVLLLLLLFQKGNPFFSQLRPGRNERLFKIIKFRTMSNARDAHGNLLPDRQRLTGVGRWVRSTSLDELPQLINVLKGDMSLVGPRPLLPEYLPLYSDFQQQRHLVKPGITGWAQVHGRNAISWESKFEYDVYYVQHLGLLMDLKILIKTLKKVVVREGITNEGSDTTQPFTGSSKP